MARRKTRAYFESEAEQLRVQLAGCAVAALGYTRGKHIAFPGDYAWSLAYADVLKLRRAYDRLRREAKKPAQVTTRRLET